VIAAARSAALAAFDTTPCAPAASDRLTLDGLLPQVKTSSGATVIVATSPR
jgi:hypothetical protein